MTAVELEPMQRPSGARVVTTPALQGTEPGTFDFDGNIEVDEHLLDWADDVRRSWYEFNRSWLSNSAVGYIARYSTQCPELCDLADRVVMLLGGPDPRPRMVQQTSPGSTVTKQVETDGGPVKMTTGKKGGGSYEYGGHPITAVLRWMGKAGWTFDQCRRALNGIGLEEVADATVRAQRRAGQIGERGEPASLTEAQQEHLTKLSQENEATS